MPRVVDHKMRRRELVDASWDVIAEQGLHGLSLRNVAKAAGCTTGRISHYFESRDALLTAALMAVNNRAARRMQAIAGSRDSVNEQLRQIAYEALPLDKSRLREWKVWIVFWAAAVNDERLALLNRQRYEEWRGLIRQLTSQLVEGEESDCHADEFISMIDGLGLRITLSPSRANRQMGVKMIDRWVGGLLD